MNRGKQTCKILKDIRRQIAAANDIELAVSECRYKGDCPGTCPRCEAEVRYLEQALERRRMAGKAVSLLGISAGLLATPAASTAEEAAMEASIAKEATIKQHFINADSTIEVTGRVVDAEGIPIPEVLVVAENKRVGTVTDSLGRFSLSVFGGEVLVFTFVGYDTQKIGVGHKTTKDILIVMDKDILNAKCGTHFERDVLLALVEGRKNSAHDVGVVDMLGKFSLDGGKTWGEQKTIFTFGEEVGKYGNPTVVLDRDTGLLNIVHMSATKSTGFNYNTFNIRGRLKDDLTFDWEEPINISLPKDPNIKRGAADGVRADTLMVGPGKAVQIRGGEFDGRIIVPASNNGSSFVIYSDDHGLTWQRSEVAGSGNECEAAVLESGEVVMVVRDGAGCCDYHPRQFQKLSYSKDGGATWYIKEKFTTLKTPICMASLYVHDGKLMLSYPDSFHTRVNLSVGTTTDGENWTSKLIYGGAAGYSCMDGDKDGNVYVLAEIGKVNYSDAIVFAKLDTK